MAMGMSRKNAKANAWLYRQKAQVRIQDALRATGLDEVTIAQEWAKLVRSRSEDIKLRTLREVSKIFGLYPESGSTHADDNITVIFDVDTEPEQPRKRTLTIEPTKQMLREEQRATAPKRSVQSGDFIHQDGRSDIQSVG